MPSETYKEQLNSSANPQEKSSSLNGAIFTSSVLAAIQAIIPLCTGMLVVLWLLRERLSRRDEVFLGIVLAVGGMGIFTIGIELGLASLGKQVGTVLPSSYQKIELNDSVEIKNFDKSLVQNAIRNDGEVHSFSIIKSAKTLKRCHSILINSMLARAPTITKKH